jgi:hypothetical protein
MGKGKDFAALLSVLQTDGGVDNTLGGGLKSGFNFTSVGVFSTTAGVPSYFNTNADPQSTGSFGTGNRHFYSNESFVIYQDSAAAIAAFAFPRTVAEAAAHTPIE